MKKTIAIMLAATLLGGALLTGCMRPTKGDIQIDISTVAPADRAFPTIRKPDPEDGQPEPTKETKRAEKTEAPSEQPPQSFSTKPTETRDGVINHGYSIKEVRERERLIRQSDQVVLTEAEAYKFLTDSITLQPEGLHFRLTETSDNDPGAYMWYKFTVYKGNLKVMNAEFDVVCFTDGTICEGRSDFTLCSFYDADDIIDSKTALKIYREKSGDERSMYLSDKCYLYTGRYQERCPVIYVYRYKKGRILVNAKTGEMIGMYKNEIS